MGDQVLAAKYKTVSCLTANTKIDFIDLKGNFLKLKILPVSKVQKEVEKM